MSYVIFDSVTGKKIAVNTAAWIAVGPASSNETSGIMLTRDVLIEVVGPMDEVLAAFEAATAPPEPETVIDPIDLDRAAKVLEILADAIANGDKYDVLAVKIDEVFGFRDPAWSATTGALSDLAARIR